MIEKTCKNCKASKPLGEFFSQPQDARANSVGTSAFCKQCHDEGKIEHGISRFLVNAGAITRGRGKFTHLFCVVNQTQEMQSFEQGMFPKDLFLPIKFDINRLFFGDQYRLSNFKVEFNTALF